MSPAVVLVAGRINWWCLVMGEKRRVPIRARMGAILTLMVAPVALVRIGALFSFPRVGVVRFAVRISSIVIIVSGWGLECV